MKSGVAVMLRIAHLVGTGALDPRVDLTWVAYDCEEVEAAATGSAASRAKARASSPATSACCSSRRPAWSRAVARERCVR